MDYYDEFNAGVEKVNVYDILGTCWGLGPNNTQAGKPGKTIISNEKFLTVIGGEPRPYRKHFTAKDYTPWLFNKHKLQTMKDQGLGEVPPCIYGTAVTDYLNRKDVREALNVPDAIQNWEMCSDTVVYNISDRGSQWVYEKLAGHIRMLHFSGDVDGAVPTDGTLAWI